MTRVERLIFLISLFRAGKRLSLKAMAENCLVSERTIYRDLQALADLNIPICFDDGYRLVQEAELNRLTLSELEIELLCFSLENSPLIRSKRLIGMLKNIELKIISAIPGYKNQERTPKIKMIDAKYNFFSRKQDNLIVECLKATVGRNLLSILPAGGQTDDGRFLADSLEINNGNWIVNFCQKNGQSEISLPLGEIEKLLKNGKSKSNP